MKQKKWISAMIVGALVITAIFSLFNALNQSMAVTPGLGEPESLQDLVEFPEGPGETSITDLTDPVDRQGAIDEITKTPDYGNVSDALANKGYNFDLEQATVSFVNSMSYGFAGWVMSCWATEFGPNGTRAFIAAALINGESMAAGGVTNLLPPDQVPEVDPYIIVNAMPYVYIRWYWYAWDPLDPTVGKIVSWYYWWYDSHSHPNWYWGCYWWWRTYVAYYWELPGVRVYKVWWWWYWHWIYWRHWYWWSTYFGPYYHDYYAPTP